jgi:hypothetical protein
MGKRSDFERVERDYYPTPMAAVLPLLPHLEARTRFVEPCAGDARLIRHLEAHGHECVGAYDIEPQHERVDRLDALLIDHAYDGVFITNPPWDRKILHPLILHLSSIAPTWLLFDADWPHTKQAGVFLPRLRKMVSVGRVKWIEDSKMTGKDNAAWYLFDQANGGPTTFHGRA